MVKIIVIGPEVSFTEETLEEAIAFIPEAEGNGDRVSDLNLSEYKFYRGSEVGTIELLDAIKLEIGKEATDDA